MTPEAEPSNQISLVIDTLYREQSRAIFATLVRLLGDLDQAEEAMHEGFAAAVKQWPNEGVPRNPKSWLISAGRFRAIDTIRRKTLFQTKLGDLVHQYDIIAAEEAEREQFDVEDDRLRLMFTCCHPALAGDVQVALTLREVCGLTTEEVASAFLVSSTTMAQRIVRGKAKIRNAKIPYQVPSSADLPERLESVLSVIYLVFNEAYSSSSGPSLTKADLSAEAIRLGRLLLSLLPDPEVKALLALMLLHESRRTARTNHSGEIVLLEDQDRSRWDQKLIAEGLSLVDQALSAKGFSHYAIQAAISGVHAQAASFQYTDWAQIVALYDILVRAQPSPVVELNRAVAVAMRDGPEVGLSLVDAILERGDLTQYHLAHAAKADFCRRLGRLADAAAAYGVALNLASQEPERRFLKKRIDEIEMCRSGPSSDDYTM